MPFDKFSNSTKAMVTTYTAGKVDETVKITGLTTETDYTIYVIGGT